MSVLDYIETKKIESIKNDVLRKFPLLGVTMSNLKFEARNDVDTACTDGNNVYFSDSFLNELTPDERTFIFAHEIMHVAFDHIIRSKNKDPMNWNIATDAVINQILKESGLPIIDGAIDFPGAQEKSAEDVYEQLTKDSEEQKQKSSKDKNNNQQNNNSNNEKPKQQNQNKISNNIPNEQQNDNNEDKIKSTPNQEKNSDQKQPENQNTDNDKNNHVGHDSHSAWAEAVKNYEQANNNKQNPPFNQNPANQNKQNKDIEKEFTKQNQQLKEEMGKKIREELTNATKKAGNRPGEQRYTIGEIEDQKAKVSWKKLLKRELEKEEDRWSYRRASEENDYMARIESCDTLEKAEIEVMLDTSGSISESLLKSFLIELKSLLRDAKLKVGCFDTKFYGFQEIKNKNDINRFEIIGRGGTNFDNAIKNFSKNKHINKIVFTDGEDYVTLNENYLKNVIWIVFDNKNFNTPNGKVVHVNSKDFNLIQNNNVELEQSLR